MKISLKFFVLYFVIQLVSCRALKSNDSIIAYQLVSPKEKYIQDYGDYQEVSFLDNDKLWISAAYFREYGMSQNVLQIGVLAQRKYGIDKILKVSSKEFGSIELQSASERKNILNRMGYTYELSLKNIDVTERKNRILKDTITLTFGKLEYKFTPSKK